MKTEKCQNVRNKYQDKSKTLLNQKKNDSDDYHKKYRKIKFKSDDDLPPKITLQLYNRIIVVRSVFHEGGKSYP